MRKGLAIGVVWAGHWKHSRPDLSYRWKDGTALDVEIVDYH